MQDDLHAVLLLIVAAHLGGGVDHRLLSLHHDLLVLALALELGAGPRGSVQSGCSLSLCLG